MTGGLYLFLRGSTRSVAETDCGFGHQDFEKKGQDWEPLTSDKARTGQQGIPPTPYSPSVYPTGVFPAQGGEPQGRLAEQRKTLNGLFKSFRDTNGFFVSTQAPRQSAGTLSVPQLPPGEVTRSSSQSASISREPAIGYPAEFLLPAATYNPSQQTSPQSFDPMAGLMPPPLYLPGAATHRRDSSLSSSGTVQIGMRLSNMNDVQAIESPRALHGSSYLQSPALAPNMLPTRNVSPLSAVDVSVTPENPRDKELPLIPLQPSIRALEAPSPAPRVRLASPRGVGFNQNAKAASPSRLRAPTFQDPPTPAQNGAWI